MAGRKLVRDLFLSRQSIFYQLTSHESSCTRPQLLLPNGYSINRRFSVFNEFSKKLKGEANKNPEFQQSVKEWKEKAEELKGVKEDLKVRTKQTTEQLYKQVDGVWSEAEATARKVSADVKEKISAASEEVKEAFGFSHKESSGSTCTSTDHGADAKKDGSEASSEEAKDQHPGSSGSSETVFGKFKSSISSPGIAFERLKSAKLIDLTKKGYEIVKDELSGKPHKKKHLEYEPSASPKVERSTRTDVVILPSKQSRWSKKWEAFKEKMQGHPMFKRVTGYSEPVVSKGQEIAEDIRERWETSDNPIVQKIQDINENVFQESDAATSFKEIRRRDPYFSLPDFVAEVQEAIGTAHLSLNFSLKMAAKRLFCETEPCLDQPIEKKRPRQTFASIIGEVVMVNSLRNLSKALEPLLRRVVNEEVDRCLLRYSRSLTRASSLRIQALEPSSFQLYFVNKLPSKMFTGNKITDVESQPLRIAVEDGGGDLESPISSSVKIEIVVLDGDFPAGDKEDWTAEEFNANIVKERSGRRPLLHGDMNITLRHGAATVGDIEFTDNSSWIRSRKFRLGARIVSGSDREKGPRIREAITDPFVVKDHRGELYKKHYPPMLHDEVWRLEKIGKDGVFHKKLNNHNIRTVQEFLKLLTIEPHELRRVLGVGMSERMWDATTKHARTCELGNKIHLFRGHNFLLFLNPICEVVRAVIGEQIYSYRDLHNIPEDYLKNLKRQAFDNWHLLQDLEGNFREPLLLTQGNEGNENEESDYIIQKSLFQGSYEFISGQVECQDWDSNSDQLISTTIQRNFHYDYR